MNRCVHGTFIKGQGPVRCELDWEHVTKDTPHVVTIKYVSGKIETYTWRDDEYETYTL